MRRGHNRRDLAALLMAGLAAPEVAFALASPTDVGSEEQIGGRLDTLARLTAPVWINGHGPYNFVVDTGSNHSIISAELAASLGLKAIDDLVINTVAGAETTGAVQVDSLVIGERPSHGAVFATAPRQSIGGPGLIGIEQLEDLRLTLDYRRRRLSVAPAGRLRGGAGRVLLRAEQRDGRLTLVGARVGRVAVTTFLDSGSQMTIANKALRHALGNRVGRITEHDPYPSIPVIGVTGQMVTGELGILPTLTVGGLYVNNLAAVFADLHTFDMWGLKNTPAMVIGVDLLRRFDSVAFDFPSGRVLFSLPGDHGPPTGTRLRGGSPTGSRVVRG